MKYKHRSKVIIDPLRVVFVGIHHVDKFIDRRIRWDLFRIVKPSCIKSCMRYIIITRVCACVCLSVGKQNFSRKVVAILMCFLLKNYLILLTQTLLKLVTLDQRSRSVCPRINNETRSIQRTQTPPRLLLLTLCWNLDPKSRSKRLMSLDVAYCIVPWYQVWCLWVW